MTSISSFSVKISLVYPPNFYICKLNVSGVQCHPLIVISICTKQLGMLLDIAN